MITVRKARDTDLVKVTPKLTETMFFARLKQNSMGPAWAFTDDGEPIALAGLVPEKETGQMELWLDVKKGISKRQRFGLIRACLRQIWGLPPYGIIRALVSDTNKNGQKLALLAGFVPSEFMFDAERGLRLWVRAELEPRNY